MKTYLSVILPLATLIFLGGCGAEQFGTASSQDSSAVKSADTYEQTTCSTRTLIKPKVDILYVVDNSSSTNYLGTSIKTSLTNTVDSVSEQFDYRVIGTTLLPVSGTDNDYQVITNSSDTLPEPSKKIIRSSEFSFFSNTNYAAGGTEPGLQRVVSFMNNNMSGSAPLFRKGAYHLVVLISNGRDTDVETVTNANGATTVNATVYNNRLASLRSLKAGLQSQQLRLFAVTPKSQCNDGWLNSTRSYVQMAKDLYTDSGATDSSTYDSFDLCTSAITTVFTSVNSSIKQVIIPHTFRYWPLSFAKDTNVRNDFGEITVYKIVNNVATVMPSSAWSYYLNPNSSLITQEPPVSGDGDVVTGKHFVKFTDGNLITYPDCVQIKSSARTEYFKYVVIQKAMNTTLGGAVRVNGSNIPSSAWVYRGSLSDVNIKAAYPNAGDEYPASIKSGIMIEITDPQYYYKSGDTVDVSYVGNIL
jgi:hypothetical protein